MKGIQNRKKGRMIYDEELKVCSELISNLPVCIFIIKPDI